MALSHDLISQFAKITKDKTHTKKETTVYGEIVPYGGASYVKLDGSDLLTPATLTVEVKAGDRVTVLLKNHTATVTGNITSPSAQVDSVTEVKNAVVDSVKTDQLNAATARISALETDNVTINNKITATEAEINSLKDGSMDADTINATFATITALNSVSASLNVLDSNFGSFKTLTTNNFSAVNASIASLQTDKLSATDIEGKYANIDFSNISKATMGEFYANSGLIQNVEIGDATISGKLVGVTISGDLIEDNTVKAEKLVIKGSDGLYYKLNTDGIATEAQQTDENSLNGRVIKAKSITATKISVTDLVAFGATIGGFKITENSLYSGVKSSPTNTTKGIYLGNDGQLFIGDATNYLKYITDANGNSKLYISADRTYSSAGNMYVTANGLFGRSASSSERYKDDITVADLSCFSGLYNLPVKKFKYKSGYLCGEDERHDQYLYDFVVEDLINVLPCAVDHVTNEEGETVPEMWNVNVVVPAMLKLIQDLNIRLIAVGGADTPSFYNPNLIDNPNFLINQRAVNGTITAEGYFVDRWKLTSGSVTINTDGSLTLNGTIEQILEIPAGTNVIASSSAGTATYNNETATFTLTGSNVTVSWVKLEIGRVATAFVAPNPATELSKCQRYFMRLDFGMPLYAGATNTTTLRFALTLPSQMRVHAPSLTMVPLTSDSYTWRIDAVDGSTGTKVSVTTPPAAILIRGNHTINITLTFPEGTAFTAYHMYGLYGAGGQYFDLSADL